MIFDFDPRKGATNFRKHGVSFAEAITALGDLLRTTIADDLHSEEEERWITLARSANGRVLVIVYTESDSTVRLISARVATATERTHYEEIG